MRKETVQTHFVHPSQLRIGLYIYLDLGWMDHPFSVSNFKITDETQIATIKGLGLKQVRYDPARSSCLPLKPSNVVEFPKLHPSQLVQAKQEAAAPLSSVLMKQQLLKHALNESEQHFIEASQQIKNIHKRSAQYPEQAFEEASALVQSLTSSVLTEGDMAIQAIHGERSGDQHYQHELNTLVLSMMLAKSAAMTEEDLTILGTAAILHDIGKRQISNKILLKKEALTMSEAKILQSHVGLGVDLLKALRAPQRLLQVVAQHHEFADGSGYPSGLKDAAIDPLTHILIVVNTYDDLCNPVDPSKAKSPYEALGMMFAQQRRLFNEPVLRRFIKCLGIYPPGSVIRLSDQRLATVISTNPQQPLRPFVQTIETDSAIEPVVIDMREALDINIVQCIKTEQLAGLLQATTLRKQRMSYFLDKALPS